MKIGFGQQVKISKKYRRFGNGGWSKIWKEVEFSSTGLFLGYRNIRNGTVESEEGWLYFVADEYITAALVSPGLNLNPVYVPLDSIDIV
jgi:hypothetical protein